MTRPTVRFDGAVQGGGGGGGGTSYPAPITLTGNTAFPDPLALWRFGGDANSGAVNGAGGQDSGLYDLTSGGSANRYLLGGTRWGSQLYNVHGHYYTGANIAALRLQAAMTALCLLRVNSLAPSTDNSVIFCGNLADATSAANQQYRLWIRNSGLGNGTLYYNHQYGAAQNATLLNTIPLEFTNGGTPVVVGFRRQADGVTVQLIANGSPLGSAATLAAPPDGGSNTFLSIGAAIAAPSTLVRQPEGTIGGVTIWDKALTDDEIMAATQAIMA